VGEAVKPPANDVLGESGSTTGNAMLLHLLPAYMKKGPSPAPERVVEPRLARAGHELQLRQRRPCLVAQAGDQHPQLLRFHGHQAGAGGVGVMHELLAGLSVTPRQIDAACVGLGELVGMPVIQAADAIAGIGLAVTTRIQGPLRLLAAVPWNELLERKR
jgi:hypothetical protein